MRAVPADRSLLDRVDRSRPEVLRVDRTRPADRSRLRLAGRTRRGVELPADRSHRAAARPRPAFRERPTLGLPAGSTKT